MRNISRQLMMITAIASVSFSCNYDDSEWDALFNHDPDPSASYYMQFDNNVIAQQLGVDEDSNPIDITVTMEVKLLGLPQSEAITATISADASSTMSSNMYTLSTTSVTIPAGKASATFNITTNAANMPECEYVTLNLNLNAGDNTTASVPGKTASFTTRKISPSPLANGLSDLAGVWGVDDTYTNGTYFDEQNFTATWDGTYLITSTLGQDFIKNFWAEDVTSADAVQITVTADGMVTIPRQHVFTTVYAGAPYDYEIEGSGTWVSLCGEAPVMKLQYDIYYEGDTDGLADSYAGFLGAPYLGATFVLK